MGVVVVVVWGGVGGGEEGKDGKGGVLYCGGREFRKKSGRGVGGGVLCWKAAGGGGGRGGKGRECSGVAVVESLCFGSTCPQRRIALIVAWDKLQLVPKDVLR